MLETHKGFKGVVKSSAIVKLDNVMYQHTYRGDDVIPTQYEHFSYNGKHELIVYVEPEHEDDFERSLTQYGRQLLHLHKCTELNLPFRKESVVLKYVHLK